MDAGILFVKMVCCFGMQLKKLKIIANKKDKKIHAMECMIQNIL